VQCIRRFLDQLYLHRLALLATHVPSRTLKNLLMNILVYNKRARPQEESEENKVVDTFPAS
jgi:hypothetical protein